MEFRLDGAQVELQQTVARFFGDRFPLESIVNREGLPLDRSVWADLASLGVLGLLVPEEAGGSGLGLVEAALVFEQVGSHLVPGPLLWTVIAAPLVDGAASGDVVVGGTTAPVDGGSVVVANAADLDVLLVVADDTVTAHRTSTLDAPAALEPLDPMTPVGRFAGLGAGDVVCGPAETSTLRLRGTALSAAVLAGVAGRALDVASAYALDRHQFDAPIGSFQAVKHLLADMYLRSTLAQSAAYAAAAVVQDPGDDDADRAASAAKLLAAESAIDNAGAAVQILGGMGFTWDMLPNHLLKRAWVVDQDLGTADDHALLLGSKLSEVT
jgi:alkylation response protein AidB-like acyl-CoA dehydrogenase